MEKNTWAKRTNAWKKAAEKARNLIIWHSWERLSLQKLPYQPEHKAYMALVVSIVEAIKAFIALDESLTK
jgi:hypothetical protein